MLVHDASLPWEAGGEPGSPSQEPVAPCPTCQGCCVGAAGLTAQPPGAAGVRFRQCPAPGAGPSGVRAVRHGHCDHWPLSGATVPLQAGLPGGSGRWAVALQAARPAAGCAPAVQPCLGSTALLLGALTEPTFPPPCSLLLNHLLESWDNGSRKVRAGGRGWSRAPAGVPPGRAAGTGCSVPRRPSAAQLLPAGAAVPAGDGSLLQGDERGAGSAGARQRAGRGSVRCRLQGERGARLPVPGGLSCCPESTHGTRGQAVLVPASCCGAGFVAPPRKVVPGVGTAWGEEAAEEHTGPKSRSAGAQSSPCSLGAARASPRRASFNAGAARLGSSEVTGSVLVSPRCCCRR